MAFLGDAVYEKLMREHILLCGNTPVAKLHNACTKRVCAEYQAKAAQLVIPILTEDELAVFRRGKNATGINPPKHSTILEYRMATALECLFGWLELQGLSSRRNELFEIIWEMGEDD